MQIVLYNLNYDDFHFNKDAIILIFYSYTIIFFLKLNLKFEIRFRWCVNSEILWSIRDTFVLNRQWRRNLIWGKIGGEQTTARIKMKMKLGSTNIRVAERLFMSAETNVAKRKSEYHYQSMDGMFKGRLHLRYDLQFDQQFGVCVGM